MDNVILKNELLLNYPKIPGVVEYICNSNSNQLMLENKDHDIPSNKKNLIFQSKSVLNLNGNNKCALNLPEKIIFIIDTVSVPHLAKINSKPDVMHESLYIVKRVIELFIHNKIIINHKHEFALVTLDTHNVHWLCDFTGNLENLLHVLESINYDDKKLNDEKNYFDLQQVFDLINQQIILNAPLLYNHIVRIILLYCRSNTIPKFNKKGRIIENLFNNPNFFIDILYIHQYINSKNRCNEIYSELLKLDVNNISYITEVSSDIEVYNCMARLLAHPMQRILQKEIKILLTSYQKFH